jgi:hypothetical protein
VPPKRFAGFPKRYLGGDLLGTVQTSIEALPIHDADLGIRQRFLHFGAIGPVRHDLSDPVAVGSHPSPAPFRIVHRNHVPLREAIAQVIRAFRLGKYLLIDDVVEFRIGGVGD